MKTLIFREKWSTFRDVTFWDISIYRYIKNEKSTSHFWVCRYRNRVQLFSNNSLGLGKLWNANFDFWFYSRWKPCFFVKNDRHFGGCHILRYFDISWKLNPGSVAILSGSVCFLNNVGFLKGLWELCWTYRTDFRLPSYFWRKVDFSLKL